MQSRRCSIKVLTRSHLTIWKASTFSLPHVAATSWAVCGFSGSTDCGNYARLLRMIDISYLLSSVLPRLTKGLGRMPLMPKLKLNNVLIGTQRLGKQRPGDKMSFPKLSADTVNCPHCLLKTGCCCNSKPKGFLTSIDTRLCLRIVYKL